MANKETDTKDTHVPPNLEGLATLLVLQDLVKKLRTLREFGYFSTNETHRLIHFNTAYLWQKWDIFSIHLLAQSEVGEVDPQTPTNQWVKDVIKAILSTRNVKKIQALDFNDPTSDPEKTAFLNQHLLETWPEALPTHILWSPFLDLSEEVSGGLIFFREHAFTEAEVKMFGWLANNYQYTWQFLTKNRMILFKKVFKKKNALILFSVILLGISLFPIRLSVVSSATVSSKSPALINAPISGIIKEFLVRPGDEVKAGQLLVTFDKRDLESSLEVNQKKLLFSEAKLRSATTQGYDKTETRSEIPILESEYAISKAELDYNKSVLARTDLYSPIDGVAVFDSKEDWVGQPVQAGENLMTIADPNQVELKISLPLSELIGLDIGTEGKFYPYGQFGEVPVRLTSLGYSAKLLPNKTLAYQFIASFTDPKSIPRLGSQGTVRLYGHYVPMIYYLLRRPFQTIRQMIGV